MKPIVAVIGPRDPGPGERQEMLARADAVFEQTGVESVARFDVPAKGAVSADEVAGPLRGGIDGVVPALQSGSLFGGKTGVLVVDADALLKGEAEIVADLLGNVDADATQVVLLASGSLPGSVAAAVKADGEVLRVKKYRERDASVWLAHAARDRRVKLHGDAVAALVQRFGSDVAALAQALDQLAASGEEVTADLVRDRFANRPEAPMWHYADAVAAGDVGTALRRLSDFLVHGHPLQLLAFVAGEVRRAALAAAAPDQATYAEWVGSKPDAFPVRKAWERRSRMADDDIRRAVGAVARADIALKTAPELTHRVTLERLTVALSLWLGGRRARV